MWPVTPCKFLPFLSMRSASLMQLRREPSVSIRKKYPLEPREIAHLIAYIKSIGSDAMVLTFQCLCSSFNTQFDHDPFDVFICCSTVILKNALLLKVAQKIVTLINFMRLFSLGFQRSCINMEVLCCTPIYHVIDV